MDQNLEGGQLFVNIAVWLIFLTYFFRAGNYDRKSYFLCLVISAVGEVYCSLIWGLYEYRLGNLPLFVPPGHVLLFILGQRVAPLISDKVLKAIPYVMGALALYLVVTAKSVVEAFLFPIFILCLFLGEDKKLYVTMFVLALAMELYGTAMGNWYWVPVVPDLNLTSTNPPLSAGTLYCVLDLIILSILGKRQISFRSSYA